jgi:hypothetical protein
VFFENHEIAHRDRFNGLDEVEVSQLVFTRRAGVYGFAECLQRFPIVTKIHLQRGAEL